MQPFLCVCHLSLVGLVEFYLPEPHHGTLLGSICDVELITVILTEASAYQFTQALIYYLIPRLSPQPLHLCDKYLLSTYSVTGTLLGAQYLRPNER